MNNLHKSRLLDKDTKLFSLNGIQAKLAENLSEAWKLCGSDPNLDFNLLEYFNSAENILLKLVSEVKAHIKNGGQ